MFKNRKEAGEKLARKLLQYRGADAVVIALPRGGVVIGTEVAHPLDLPLDVIATRKIGHPSSPEYAIGSVDQNGLFVLNEDEAKTISASWLQGEIGKQTSEARRRTHLYRKGRGTLHLRNKIVIAVDDGIATGFTMRLAVKAVKAQEPKKIVVAVPVAPPEAIRLLKSEGADEVLVLEEPTYFLGAVGAHYKEFPQVDDEEVVHLLHAKK